MPGEIFSMGRFYFTVKRSRMTKTSSTTIKHLPKSERPRERLNQLGPGALSVQELIAIILRLGTTGVSAVELANRLLVRFGDLKRLAQASIEELLNVEGMGETKAVSLKAAFELGRRLNSFTEDIRPVIKRPEDVYNLLADEMRLLPQEIFKVVILNTKNEIVRTETITIGTLNTNIIHPRELFRPAIRANANTLLLVHNHPSGDPEPSKEDILITKRLIDASRIVDIEIEDHIVIGDGRFVSMRGKGYI